MPPEPQQDSFDAVKRSVLNSHAISDPQKRPWLSGQSALDGGLDSGDFGFINRSRIFPNSHHLNDPRDRENREPIQRVELTERIPRKQRKLNFLEAVRPPPSVFVCGEERFVPPGIQMHRHDVFVPTSDAQRIPLVSSTLGTQTNLRSALKFKILFLTSYRHSSPMLWDPWLQTKRVGTLWRLELQLKRTPTLANAGRLHNAVIPSIRCKGDSCAKLGESDQTLLRVFSGKKVGRRFCSIPYWWNNEENSPFVLFLRQARPRGVEIARIAVEGFPSQSSKRRFEQIGSRSTPDRRIFTEGGRQDRLPRVPTSMHTVPVGANCQANDSERIEEEAVASDPSLWLTVNEWRAKSRKLEHLQPHGGKA